MGLVRVLVGGDERLVRDALATVLDLDERVEVVQRSALRDVVHDVARHRPHVTVLSVDDPCDELEVLAAPGVHEDGHRFLVLAPDPRPGLVRRSLAAGAAGVLSRDSGTGGLVEAVHHVAGGRRWVDPRTAGAALQAAPCPLTPRELDVLELAAAGTPAREIARRTALSPGTVRNYLSAVLAKLDVPDRAGAVRVARDSGWI